MGGAYWPGWLLKSMSIEARPLLFTISEMTALSPNNPLQNPQPSKLWGDDFKVQPASLPVCQCSSSNLKLIGSEAPGIRSLNRSAAIRHMLPQRAGTRRTAVNDEIAEYRARMHREVSSGRASNGRPTSDAEIAKMMQDTDCTVEEARLALVEENPPEGRRRAWRYRHGILVATLIAMVSR